MPLPKHRVLEHNGNQDKGEPPAQPAGVELPPAIRADLLDPALWQDGLAKYARATHLAVALVDAAGRLIGAHINPRPTWSLLYAKPPPTSPPSEGAAGRAACPFSLAPLQHHPACNCVADALAKGGVVVARDRTGLVHFAVPLVLGEHRLGALVAGQVFDQYPEQLPLEHVAKQLGLSPAPVWQRARLEHPVKRATLEVYADLLATLGQTFLRTRYHTLIEAERLAEMTRLRDRAIAETTQRHALQEADRRKSEFLAMLGHELRNPLASILNAVHLLQRLGPAEPRLVRTQEIIERQTIHQARLVDDLLDVSRISRGTILLRPERLDLVRLVRNAAEDSRSALEEAGLLFTLALPEEPVWVEGDPTRLAQVVGNLCQNAAKFTHRGGRVTVTLNLDISNKDAQDRQDEGEKKTQSPSGSFLLDSAVIRVRDTGIGIEPKMLPRVFEAFAQADCSLDRSRGGLGLGLALVKGLVELHGGEVRADSAGVGSGTEITLRLPLAPAPRAPEKVPAPAAGPAGPLRVLIVEDNRDAAESLRELLEFSGHTVEVAYSGRDAVQSAQQFQPGVVVCDLGLPGMDGHQVAAALRQSPATANVRLIALSGYGQEEDLWRSAEAGFDLHLTKPVDFAKLERLLAAGPGVGQA